MAITRTATSATGGITQSEQEEMDKLTKFWVANALSTEPVKRPALVDAVQRLYAAASLKTPRVEIVSSPLAMAIAGGIAMALYWVKDHTAEARRESILTSKTAPDSPVDIALDVIGKVNFSVRHDLVVLAAIEIASRETHVHQEFFSGCINKWSNLYDGGNMWSGWCCYVAACRDILHLDLPEFKTYQPWEDCALNGGFRLMHKHFCFVCDRPEVLTIDNNNRAHNETGPSHKWRDGMVIYTYHGVTIPYDKRYIIDNPSQITVADIDAENNVEIRRVMTERYGEARYISDGGAEIVHEIKGDHPIIGLRGARLFRKDVPNDEALFFVEVVNSTPEADGSYKKYMLPVDPRQYGGAAGENCHAAIASTWRFNDESGNPTILAFPDYRDYAPTVES